MGSSHRPISNRLLPVRSVLLHVVKPWLSVSRDAHLVIAKATVETLASNGNRSACRREFGQRLPGKSCLSKSSNRRQPEKTECEQGRDVFGNQPWPD
jgi:hypothetical protein